MILIEDPLNCMLRRNNLVFPLMTALASIVNAAGTLTWTPDGQSAKSLSVYNEVGLETAYIDNYTVQTFSFALYSEAANPS